MAKKERLSLEALLEQALVKNEDKPYEVPENWVWTRIGSIFEVTSSKRVFKEEWKKYGVPFYRTREVAVMSEKGVVDNELFISEEMYSDYVEKYGIPEVNDLIVTGVGTLGKVYVVKENDKFYFKDGNIIWFKRISKVMSIYIKFLFQSMYMINQIEGLSRGTTVGTYTIINAKNTIIPLPPLPEQHRIVALIESLFEKLDRAKELAQNALDSFENRKTAILHKAFTGELTREWREENGVDFERDWMEKALGKCGEWFGGGTPSKSHPQFWVDGNLLWVTPKDMKSVYIKDTEDKITEIALEKSSAKLIPNAAVLFVVRSGILRRILPIALTTRPVTVNQDMKAIIPRDIDIKFFYWYCLGKESDIRNKCAKNGTTVESISSDLLYKYEILVPPLKEQQEIVRILDNLLENEQKAKNLCDVIDKIDHMKKSILARAFRGELGTNKPEEESALKLLKEVLREKA